MSDTAGTTKPMQLAGGDPGEAMVMYLVGMAAVVREEFGGSLDGASVMLPEGSWEWMPQLIERFNLTDRVKQQYGRKLLEIRGYSIFWNDEGSSDGDFIKDGTA
jgi:hypothetical protein